MNNAAEFLPGTNRARRAIRAAALSLAVLAIVTACSPPPTSITLTVGPDPSPSASPATSPSVTPTPPPPPPPPAGWPRDGWTMRTGLAEGLNGVAVYFPDSWTFDTNESGLWWDGTYHVFCNVYLDHTLLQAGGPNVQTLATTQWNLIGYGAVANQQGFTTFYGYDGWRGDVTGQKGTEHRAYVLVGDVWINCGAITRDTTASGDELWDIVDSIQIPPPELPLTPRAWNVAP